MFHIQKLVNILLVGLSTIWFWLQTVKTAATAIVTAGNSSDEELLYLHCKIEDVFQTVSSHLCFKHVEDTF